MMKMIKKCAILLVRNNRVLLTREENDKRFLTPGGKYNDGETDIQCLQRELEEEIGTKAKENTLKFLQEFEYEDGDDRTVNIRTYTGELENEPKPSGEIEEIKWFSREDLQSLPVEITTKITKYKILPFLIERNML